MANRPIRSADEGAGEFGSWVWQKLGQYESRTGRRVTIEMLAEEGNFDYSHLHGIIKGKRGVPVKARPDTVVKLVEALNALGVNADASEAMDKAGITPEGYIFMPVGADGGREAQSRASKIVAAYNNAPPAEKRIIKRVLGLDESDTVEFDEYDEGPGQPPPPGSHN